MFPTISVSYEHVIQRNFSNSFSYSLAPVDDLDSKFARGVVKHCLPYIMPGAFHWAEGYFSTPHVPTVLSRQCMLLCAIAPQATQVSMMYVSFYNTTASTWTLGTPRTTWESDAQDYLHFELADTDNIAGDATEFLKNKLQTLSAWAVQRPGPLLAHVDWTLSFGKPGRNACTDTTVPKRLTHASGSISVMITISPVIMQLC